MKRTVCGRIRLWGLLLVLLLMAAVPASAGRTIRVGSTGVEGFVEYLPDGTPYGYAVEYLKEIAAYTGWHYEFVPGTWAESMERLKRGEIDLLPNAQYTEERAQSYLFSRLPSGTEYGIFYARKGNEGVFYNDHAAFNGMKIGLIQHSYYNEALVRYARLYDFTYTPVEYASPTEAFKALDLGAVDAVVIGGLNGKQGYKVVAKFEPMPFHFITGKGNTELMREVDRALEQIKSIDPYFEATLYKDYYGQTSAERQPLYTREEAAYIATTPELRVGCLPDSFPFSLCDENGKVTGIYEDVLQLISKNSGLRFSSLPLNKLEKPLSQIRKGSLDLALGIVRTEAFLRNPDYTLSEPFLQIPIVAAMRTTENFQPDQPMTVAITTAYESMNDRIRHTFPHFRIIYKKDTDACLRAVRDGEADLVLQKAYLIQYLLQKPTYDTLTIVPINEIEESVCLATTGSANPLLMSVLNKTISALDPRDINNIIIQHTIRNQYVYTLGDFAYKYRVTLSIIGVLLFLCLTLGLLMARQRHRSYQALEESNKHLSDAISLAEHANQAKSAFLSKMSHEIRTPMNAVIGMATIAINNLKDPQKVRDSLSKILYSSKILLNLINDVLDMSAIENEKLRISHIPFDFKTLLQSIADIYYGQCRQKGVAFDMILSGVSEERLIGDQLRLHQILLNLLSNALKFTDRGGSVKLKITQHDTSGDALFLSFSVSDTGQGMTPEFMSRIFKPFEQQESSTALRFGGSGLGLSISKNLVELMGGTIRVESELGKGTTFHVELPFERTGDEPQGKNELSFKKIRILVVDDEQDSREYTSVILNRMELAHDCVRSGEEALAAFTARQNEGKGYDLCIIDWKMPNMGGLETSRRLREIADKDTTIIICTAYALQEVEDEAKNYGVDMCIPKPLFQSTLFNLLVGLSGRAFVRHSEEPENFDFTGKRVLLAEDNIVNMEVAVGLLGMVGLNPDRATNGREAVDMFLKSEPGSYDLVLLDVQMPVMGGYEAAKVMRQAERPDAKTIPILAMTANAFTEDISAALAAGMNDHIAKPIDTRVLYATLNKYLNT